MARNITNVERNVVQSAFKKLYDSGVKRNANDVPLGSVVLLLDPEDDEEEALYIVLTIYRISGSNVRASFMDDTGNPDFDRLLNLDDKVVILQAAK